MNSRQKTAAMFALVMSLAIIWLMLRARRGTEGPPPPTPARPAPPARQRTDLRAEVVRRAKEATVFIQVTSASYLDEEIREEASGSGFFLTPDGQVATCWHVISASKNLGGFAVPLKPESIQVIVRSGRRDQKVLPARLLAADPAADLAILKVDSRNCPHLKLGKSAGMCMSEPGTTTRKPRSCTRTSVS